jgi:hypothetical protein
MIALVADGQLVPVAVMLVFLLVGGPARQEPLLFGFFEDAETAALLAFQQPVHLVDRGEVGGDLARFAVGSADGVDRVGGQPECPALADGEPVQEGAVRPGLPARRLRGGYGRPAGLFDQVREVGAVRADDVEVHVGSGLVVQAPQHPWRVRGWGVGGQQAGE